VVAEGTDFIVRNAVIMNDEITEIITFVPKQKVSLHQFKSPRDQFVALARRSFLLPGRKMSARDLHRDCRPAATTTNDV